ncbi:rhamnan synthesis F family protein [Enterococcus asini]|uniref:rhamnan synthesis F family protein n=1 Tax=Enterococcus asini TaxID=57732 RepID=UPI002890F830|nr:rhamnan synthesis F family protein [Enterococcus asini]MDT2756587.1 rhamnan synthesis F family protein [Enterococcus asini]
MSSLVTVVVTAYNHEKYIEECLNSVFQQTYQNIELIVINDGSTDNSEELIKNTLASSPFSHTEYIYQKNGGLVAARNATFSRIDGDFVLFVDSDNFLDADYIEKLVHQLKVTGGDIAYGDLYDPDSKIIVMKSQEFSLETLLLSNYIDSCSLIRTSVIGDTRYDVELNRKKLEDYDFFLQLIINQGAVPVYCPEAKLNYRVLNDSMSRKTDEAYYYEVYLYILKKFLQPKNDKVYSAIKETVLHLENRLSDLINHLGDVTEYVHSLEDTRDNQNGQITTLSTTVTELNQNIERLDREKNELSEKFVELSNLTENRIHDLETRNQELDTINQELHNQKEQLIHSKSYRIGNSIVRPAKFAAKIVRNPKEIKPFMGRVKRYVGRVTLPYRHPQKKVLKLLREAKRKQNNYENPSRVLVYVIYENKPILQEYKVIFLEALAKLSDKVLIVVNGSVNEEDKKRLAEFGEVVFRDNAGYDTAGFRYGIQYLGKETLANYDELLLVNDTNVGPFGDLKETFAQMAQKKVDFWGITYGEAQPDFTGYNKYKYIPVHLQSFFLVIEKSMFSSNQFFEYWEALKDTNSRNKAIGRHETVFTTHFENLGFIHSAITEDNSDSGIYIHPMRMINAGVPLAKYTAFANYDNDKFAWQGLIRQTEVPELLDYIENKTDYPMNVINDIMYDVQHAKHEEHILIIDGVENAIPQLTKYRVDNKVEQLESLGFKVWKVNASGFQMGYAEHASHIIIYRAPFTDNLGFLCQLAKKYHKPVLYDIDDLVIDTKYTDQLAYTNQISVEEKRNYDAGVNSYGAMLKLCDGAITTTGKLKEELENYQDLVLLNRNLASRELVEISSNHLHEHNVDTSAIVRIGYFSGSITHNENFELVRNDLIKLLKDFKNVELHLVGHLDIPEDFKEFGSRIVTHSFVEWRELPELIAKVDINLAPLVDSVFNEAKSEIKWLEAALVNVPTVASDLGAFKEMIESDVTGVLVKEDWYGALEQLTVDAQFRSQIAENARQYVLERCTTDVTEDELTLYLGSKK